MQRKYPIGDKYAAQKAWRIKNKEKVNADWKKLRSKNLERFKSYNLKTRLKHTYGISLEEYKKLVEEGGNICPICGRDANCIDHNHLTGKVRGILCRSCNNGLGMFRDNPIFLENAAKYLLNK